MKKDHSSTLTLFRSVAPQKPIVIHLKNNNWVTGFEQCRDYSTNKTAVIIEPLGDLELEYAIEKTRQLSSRRIRIYCKDIVSCDLYDPTKHTAYHSDPSDLVKRVAWPQWIEPKIKPSRRKKLLQELKENQYSKKYYLVKAIEDGFQDIFENLLDEEMLKDAFNEQYVTSSLLYYAVKHGRPLVAKLLIDKGYPLPNKKGQSDIFYELQKTGNLKLLELLLGMGFDPNVDQSKLLLSMLKMGNSEAVALLIQAGARVNTNLLDAAIAGGNAACLALLLEAGMSISVSTIFKVLKYADPQFKFRNVLFQQELDVNACFSDGMPLLIKLIREKFIKVEPLQFLIDQGADLNVTFEGKNALAHAKEREYPESIVAFFEDIGMQVIVDEEEVAAVAAVKVVEDEKARIAAKELEAKRLAAIPKFLKPDGKIKFAEEYQQNEFFIRKAKGKLPIQKKRLDGLKLIGEDIKTYFGLSSHSFNHIAEVRAKLQFLFGSPTGKGDGYKTSFEYQIEIEGKNGVKYYFTIFDWKARTVYGSFIFEGQDEQQIAKADIALWGLIEKASFGDFKDKYAYDEWNKVRYECVAGKPWGDFPD